MVILHGSGHAFGRTYGTELEAFLECRVAVEPTHAARNRTDEQLAEIKTLHEKFINSTDYVAHFKAITVG
tara:strand:+ start:172 stop:381 length:210 start_codon:yes stop_codon:yes gene_type:complete